MADAYGVYGEVAIVPASALAAYPKKLSFEEGTSIWMQYFTAWGALCHFGKLAKGDYVLITAASSSVGIAAIEICKAEGAISIATTRTRAKREELLACGADHVIVTQEEKLVQRVMEITAGKGARLIFDPVAGRAIMDLAGAAAPHATIFEYGALAAEPTPMPLYALLLKHLTIRGYTLFELMPNPETRQAGEQYIYGHLESGTFHPRIDKVFHGLASIVEAHRYMESNAQIGKIVVSL
jgi:NADPH:quinone reductase-like Zn-dependent oxidoreductase